MTRALRVLLVDDHPIVRDGMRAVVERIDGASVIGEADNGRDAVELAATQRPDLVIMDIGMKELNGIDATAQMKERAPSTRVLILSGHSSSSLVLGALRAGADGYLLKDSAASELRTAIDSILAGNKYLSPSISRHVVQTMLEPNAMRDRPAAEALSSRQREVLQMIAEGKSTKQIAFVLGVSTKTVETHRARIMERLDIHDVPGLVIYAIRAGMIHLDTDPS